MSERKNPFDALADLESDNSAENPFALFEDPLEADDENPFETKASETQVSDARETTLKPETVKMPLLASIETVQETVPESHDTSDTDEEPPNPIMTVMEQQEQQSLFVKRPVFKYGSAEDEIEDTEQTFEDLRVAKSQDFPELEDANRVTWIVTYGKTIKNVSGSDVKKTKLGEFKRSIEMSKDFMSALKKAKDKNPTCEIKPSVRAQSKGERTPSYKGVFTNVDEADNSGKLICLVPGSDGTVYEIRNEEMGRFITPAGAAQGLCSIKAGFIPALPLVPSHLLLQIVSFFRSMLTESGSYEAIANILWDRYDQTFITVIPKQEVGHVSAKSILPELDIERYLHYMDIHSHNVMNAKFSGIDDRDEKATRLYAVLGRLDNYFPRIKVRMSNGGKYMEINPALVFEPFWEHFPIEWSEQVTFMVKDGESGCAA